MPQNPTDAAGEALGPRSGTKRELGELVGLSEKFGATLTRAFAKNVAEGKRFDEVLKGVGRSLVAMGLRAALQPLQSALADGLKGALQGLFGGGSDAGAGGLLSQLVAAPTGLARGGILSRGAVMPFAAGGVVGAPTYFPMRGGLGLMGERGAEAVMPLARGPDGRLGVEGGGRPVSVTVNIATEDAESFRRSEAQVAASLARAVARGQRGS